MILNEKRPLLSVVMPVYNCEKYIEESIKSILNQTYRNFELIIIDDCSTDLTYIKAAAFEDPRIILIKKKRNTGLSKSLNIGVAKANGEYIARMDGDDISLPDRFYKQIEFLNKNQEVGLCGTAIKIIGEQSVLRYPTFHDAIKVSLCLGTAIMHPTVVVRTEILRLNQYDESYEPAEDYELWTRLIFKTKFANLEDVTLLYRRHEGQVSSVKRQIQIEKTHIVRTKMFNSLELKNIYNDSQLKRLINLYSELPIEECKEKLNLYKVLEDKNKEIKEFDVELFNRFLLKDKASFLRRRFGIKDFFKLNVFIFFIIHVNFIDFIKWMNLKKRLKTFLNNKYID